MNKYEGIDSALRSLHVAAGIGRIVFLVKEGANGFYLDIDGGLAAETRGLDDKFLSDVAARLNELASPVFENLIREQVGLSMLELRGKTNGML